MVSKEEIHKQYTDLKNRILELNESYHRHDISEVSDEKYDSLFKELIDFEKNNGEIFNLKVKNDETEDIIAIASKNHLSSKTETWLADRKIKNIISASSSIKFCAIAKGDADVYPRFSPTMEWDIAAGDAILSGAGGRITIGDSKTPISYGKPNFKNSEFIAWSDLKIV